MLLLEIIFIFISGFEVPTGQKYSTRAGSVDSSSLLAYQTIFVATVQSSHAFLIETFFDINEIFGDGNMIFIPLVINSSSLPGLNGI